MLGSGQSGCLSVGTGQFRAHRPGLTVCVNNNTSAGASSSSASGHFKSPAAQTSTEMSPTGHFTELCIVTRTPESIQIRFIVFLRLFWRFRCDPARWRTEVGHTRSGSNALPIYRYRKRISAASTAHTKTVKKFRSFQGRNGLKKSVWFVTVT